MVSAPAESRCERIVMKSALVHISLFLLHLHAAFLSPALCLTDVHGHGSWGKKHTDVVLLIKMLTEPAFSQDQSSGEDDRPPTGDRDLVRYEKGWPVCLTLPDPDAVSLIFFMEAPPSDEDSHLRLTGKVLTPPPNFAHC